jgi:hypothetical protein
MNNGESFQKGSTLIELLIYLAITTGILIGAGGIGWTVLEQEHKSRAQNEISYARNFVQSQLAEDIRSAIGVTSPAFALMSSTSLVLLSYDPLKNPTMYFSEGGMLYRKSGARNREALLPSIVRVSGLSFVRQGATGTPISISAIGTLTTGTDSIGNSYSASFPLNITSTLRTP